MGAIACPPTLANHSLVLRAPGSTELLLCGKGAGGDADGEGGCVFKMRQTGAPEERGSLPRASVGAAGLPSAPDPIGCEGECAASQTRMFFVQGLGISRFQMAVFKMSVLRPMSFREEPICIPQAHAPTHGL